MTDATGGYLPPSDRGIGDGAQVETPSRTDAAKDQAGQLGQTARQSGQQVASTAKDQVRNVAGESRRQAKDLTREARSQMNEQAGVQKQKATEGLRSLSHELRSMAATSEQGGPATDLAHQAAGKIGDAAQWLESREPGQLVDEVRDVARRRPGTFLLGAAIAGVIAGRLTRGAVQAARDDDSSGNGSSPTPQSGSFAGETYPTTAPAETTLVTEPDVLVVQDDAVPVGNYATERNR